LLFIVWKEVSGNLFRTHIGGCVFKRLLSFQKIQFCCSVNEVMRKSNGFDVSLLVLSCYVLGTSVVAPYSTVLTVRVISRKAFVFWFGWVSRGKGTSSISTRNSHSPLSAHLASHYHFFRIPHRIGSPNSLDDRQHYWMLGILKLSTSLENSESMRRWQHRTNLSVSRLGFF
jgi:hypothetical protein